MKNYLPAVLLFVISYFGYSQSVDFERVAKETPIRIRGGISANTIFYNSNLRESRLPFTYYFNGNLTFSIYGFNVPLTFNYSNQGSELGYKLPFNLNRLSIHPKYKWATAHIGDVSMNFSPYTLGGHQFTGVGFDIAPKGPFKISAMAGRLLKATEDDGNELTIPAFRRIGYGLKTEYTREKFKIGITGFYAKDDINSLKIMPDAKNITPKENLALSLESSFKITESLSIFGEYANSILTNDIRSDILGGNSGVFKSLLKQKTSTESFYAVKGGLNYQVKKTVVILSYERVSPDYETLGAYYFNNDFENITVNASQPFFNDKLNLRLNVGFQRDDLENKKTNATSRIVGAINATIHASEKLDISGSYSNFQTYTNVKLNQFDVINDNTNLDNITDTLNYRQLSQAANLNVNYLLKKMKENNQSLNFNYSFNDVANEQGGIVRIGNASTFHNLNSSYSLSFPQKKVNMRLGGNVTLNTIGKEDAVTWGPMLNITKRLLEDKLNTGLSFYYSNSKNKGINSNIMNIRANLNYTLLQKHNFMLSGVQLFRNSGNMPSLNELTITFGYNYNFGLYNPKKKKKGKPKKEEKSVKIKFKDYSYEGSIANQVVELTKFSNDSIFYNIPQKLRNKFKNDIHDLSNQEISLKDFKRDVILSLDELYSYKTIEKNFKKDFRLAFSQLLIDAKKLDEKIYNKYLSVKENLKKAEIYKNKESYLKLSKELKIEESKLNAHRQMISDLEEINKIENDADFNVKTSRLIKQIMPSYYDLRMENKNNQDIIIKNLQVKIADYYHKR